ncbi:germination protein YpeB [Ectobacillus sp. JY-23]|uniref:germination protein YpeB n=1 Tax=Ectobacillus sp. JY-23 TaxID=2933872 RepID=UPI001FF6CBD8|nr:germination protein YpeB [Ectobacillus sp. JY-23]UOY93013.1 germination protein YpeB [Ectobacillus sp. JY-23]
MLRGLLIIALTFVVAGTGYWGYLEHQEKNAVLIHAENNYQRAFHELTYEMDLLHDKIGNTLAMNSRTSLSPALADVWRITSEARSDVGQLPLTLLPFNKTEEFLASIGDFSYRTAVRDLEKEPLNDKEYATLQQLHQKSADIQNELRHVQHLVLKNNLRWMDVELALAADRKPSDNTIIDGFKTVEKNVNSYTEADFGPTFTSYKQAEKGLNKMEGQPISKQQAKEIAQSFLGIKTTEGIKVEETGEKKKDRYYSLSVQQPNTKSEIYMDITQKGGHPVWLINNREIGAQKIDLNAASIKGATFLKNNKFANMELFESSQYDSVGVFTYVTNLNGIRIYPESINMKVALDDGSIVGFSAKDYLAAYQGKRSIPKPKLSVEEARKKVNPNLKVLEERKAIIINDLNKEVLCYEFVGTLNNDTYQIFINADTAFEEQVKKLNNIEENYD